MTPLRVAFVAPNLEVGGLQRALVTTARHARELSVEMVVISLGWPKLPAHGTVREDLEAHGAIVHDLRLPRKASRSARQLVRAAIAVRHLCLLHQVHVVESSIFDSDIAARLALLGTDIPHVTRFVSTPYTARVRAQQPHSRRWRLDVVRWLDARTARLTDHFIANTSAAADQAARDLGLDRARVHVLARGVDLDEFRAIPPRLDGTDLRLLSVGRLVASKGHDVAVRAMAHVASEDPSISLSIVGDGERAAHLRDLRTRLGLTSDQVAFLGARRDVANLLAQHDAFVFPSLWEGIGNALLEAMASARPVIASDLPALREVMGGAGLLFPAGDPLALAEMIRWLSRRSLTERAELGAWARNRVTEKYAAGQVAQRLFSYYRHIVSMPES